MKRRLRAITGLVVLILLGVGAAVAVAGTSGTTSVCATTPAHTVAVDGTDVSTIAGDTSCVITTYTVPTVTDTVTVTEAAQMTTTTTASPTTGGTPGIGVLGYGGNLKYVTGLDSYSLVIGSSYSTDTPLLAGAVGRSLTYFDGTDVNKNYSTGVTYTDALASGWLLKDSLGNLMTSSTYGTYCADIGSSGYQQKWIADVLAYLAAHPGLDGVFVDNVLADPKADCGGYPAKYPTTAAYSAAQVSFLQAVYPALHAKGYYLAINASSYRSGDSTYNDGTSVVNWWKVVGPYSDGIMNENYDETAQFALRSSASTWQGYFDGWQRLVGTAQSMGKDFIGLTKSSGFNNTFAAYGKASFLLEWDGGGSAYIYTCGGTCDPSSSSWTANIGIPSAPKFAVGVGYERAYTKGTVLVNPSPSSSQTFSVGGTSYTLAPTTARILGD